MESFGDGGATNSSSSLSLTGSVSRAFANFMRLHFIIFPHQKMSSFFLEYVVLHNGPHDCTASIDPQIAILNIADLRFSESGETYHPCTLCLRKRMFRRRVNRLDRWFPKHPSVSDFNFNVGRGCPGMIVVHCGGRALKPEVCWIMTSYVR